MRLARLLITALLAAVALAGCADDEPGPMDDMTPAGPEPEAPSPPDNITESGTVNLGADPYNIATGEPCSLPAPLSACTTIPFSLNASATVDALLTWGLPVNDLDLYLYTADGTLISNEGINLLGDPPNTEHDMPPIQLTAGDYEFVISFWLAVGESYEFTATFGA